MKFYPDKMYHVYNRGNNSRQLFLNYGNYVFFLQKIRDYFLPNCDILSYCLMPNHFHFLIQTHTNLKEQSLNQAVAIVLRSYSQGLNKQLQWSGSMFQQKTKAKEIETDAYGLTCFHYIHQNPLAAKLVSKMENWEFGSFKDYIGMRNGTLCNQQLAKELIDLPLDRAAFYQQSYAMIDPDKLSGIF